MSNRANFYMKQEVWNDYINEPNKERIRKTIEMIPDDGISLLDVGCGNGAIINNISSFVYAVGIDSSTQALEYVNRNKIAGVCNSLPFKDKTFDIVISAEMLEHLDNQTLSETIIEFQRVAKKYILISVPFKEKPWETFVKCAYCGCTYSPYYHQQYFDEKKVKGLWRSKCQIIQFCGVKQVLPKIKRMGQKVGIYSYRKDSICPNCSSSKLKYGIIEKLYNYGLACLQNIFAEEAPNWILCLYKVED